MSISEILSTNEDKQVVIQFCSPDGKAVGSLLNVPLSIHKNQFQQLLNAELENEEKQPYSFTLQEHSLEITTTLEQTLSKLPNLTTESVLSITFFPLSLYHVFPITRCTTTLEGHTEAVLTAQFSPDGTSLATGSGDTTVRIWDILTETPLFTLKKHKNWVLCISWSTDGKLLASAGMDNTIWIWDPLTGQSKGKALNSHSKPITSLAWEPLHCLSNEAITPRLASGSKDFTIKIWDVLNGFAILTLSSHTNVVTSIKWSGEGYIYSGSRDTLIKVWDSTDGRLLQDLKGHAHWVNTLALNTDYVLRTGWFDWTKKEEEVDIHTKKEIALKRYQKAIQTMGEERLISGSDDFTMFLWKPKTNNKPLTRLTGHQKLVNHVLFSPDGRFIASASFDKSIRLWDGHTGKFLNRLRGHVSAVYQLAFSADSRMLVSCSADSTIKLWDVRTHKITHNLYGHADEIYAIDWNPNTSQLVSGSKDRTVKLWKN